MLMHFLAAVAVPVASAVSTGGDHTGQPRSSEVIMVQQQSG